MRAQLAAAPARRLGTGPSRRTRSAGGYTPDPVSAGPARAGQPGAGACCACDARAHAATPSGPARAYQRFKDADQHDRPPRRAERAGSTRTPNWPTPALERFHELFQRRRAGARQVVLRCRPRAPEPRRPGASPRVKALMKHPDFSLKQPEPRAQPDLHAAAAATRPRSTAPTPPATCSGPTACSSSTPSTRNSPPAWRACWTAGATLAEPYRSAAREAIARVAAKPDLSATTCARSSRARSTT